MSLLLWQAADDVGVTSVSDAQAAAAVVAAACSTKIDIVCRQRQSHSTTQAPQ